MAAHRERYSSTVSMGGMKTWSTPLRGSTQSAVRTTGAIARGTGSAGGRLSAGAEVSNICRVTTARSRLGGGHTTMSSNGARGGPTGSPSLALYGHEYGGKRHRH